MDIVRSSKPHACFLCNKSFTRKYDLNRHQHTVHSEKDHNMDEKDEVSEVDGFESEASEIIESESNSTEESQSEQEEEEESDTEMSSDDLEDNAAYQEWYEQSKEDTQEMWTEKYEKYINEGMGKKAAKEKADMKTSWAIKHTFFKHYELFLLCEVHLQHDDTHQEIVADLQEKVDNGTDVRKAVKRVLAKHQTKFDGLLQEHEDEDIEEDEESDGLSTT